MESSNQPISTSCDDNDGIKVFYKYKDFPGYLYILLDGQKSRSTFVVYRLV